MKRKFWIVLALSALFALVASACSPSTDDDLAGRAISEGASASGSSTDDADDTDNAGAEDQDPSDDSDLDDDDSSNDQADDDSSSDGETDGEPVGDTDDAPVDDGRGVAWTVIAVGWNDTLNVRADPDASADIVAELEPWTTNVATTGETSGTTSRWRELVLDDGTTGWVNDRFLVAQPAVLSDADEAELADLGQDLVDWVTTGTGDPGPLITDRGVWTAGIGIYADAGSEWNWIAASDLQTSSGWEADRNFAVDPGLECGSECTLSTRAFLNLDRIDDTTQVLVNDIAGSNEAHLEGMLWEAPRSLHRVVIDTPTSDPEQSFDWQRLHLIPDWSGGQLGIKAMHNHGWTP